MDKDEAKKRDGAAITAIVNGADIATAKGIRPDLIQYGGTDDVSFLWGDNKKGLYHIGCRRGADVVREVITAVIEGSVVRRQAQKKTVILAYNGYEAVLALDMNGDKNTWLLTGWEKDVPDAVSEVSTQSDATQTKPTFSRPDLGAATLGLNIPCLSEKSSGHI
jgi:hypothetical protein